MIIDLIASGDKMPKWVQAGFLEYAKRLPPECRLRLSEIPSGRRGKKMDIQRVIDAEGQAMLAAVKKGSHMVVLDIKGKAWSTVQLSENLSQWLQQGQNIALLIGGPDGLSKECLQQAKQTWSLGPLTLPHPLVRVLVAEQIYRAWSILKNHPYHRA